jgi:hypothetical protein
MPRKRLPDPDAPLRLADGSVVAPTTALTFGRVEVPSNTQAQRIVSSTRRKLADLPAMPKQMNSFAVVLVYTASGLSDGEIAVATGFDEAQVQWMRTQAAYRQLESMVIEAAQQEAAQEVKHILVQGEKRAAQTVVGLLDSEYDAVALQAAKDLLDRGGHKPSEKMDIHHHMESTFRIEVIDKRETGVPVIDMEPDP